MHWVENSRALALDSCLCVKERREQNYCHLLISVISINYVHYTTSKLRAQSCGGFTDIECCSACFAFNANCNLSRLEQFTEFIKFTGNYFPETCKKLWIRKSVLLLLLLLLLLSALPGNVALISFLAAGHWGVINGQWVFVFNFFYHYWAVSFNIGSIHKRSAQTYCHRIILFLA